MTKGESTSIYWLYNIFTNVFQYHNGYTYSASKRLELNWNLEIEKCKNPNLLKMLIKTFGIWPLLVGAVYSIIEMISRIQISLYVGCIVSYYANEVTTSVSTSELHRSIVGLVIFTLLIALLAGPMKMYSLDTGMKMRVACSSLIYQKSLNTNDCKISGLVLRLLTVEVQNLENFLLGIHHIWRMPFETLIFGYLIYREVGTPAIFGMLVILTAIPIQTILTRLIIDCEMHLERATMKRAGFVKEMINGIKVVKMYTWEKLFEKTVQKLREREINVISQHSHLHSVLHSLNIIPRLAAFATFITFILSGNSLLSNQVFMISLIFQFLNLSILQSFPMALAEFLQTVNSVDRIKCFLLNCNGRSNAQIDIDDLLKNRIYTSMKTEIVMDNVSATWNNHDEAGVYSIDLNLQSDRIYGITGKAGCGKSTLINTIIGELEPYEGKIEIKGTISYASQEPWLFNDTIRQNILFGADFDEHRYTTVCQVCGLDRDFEILEFGDDTKVDERSLSDEQKSKINLARSIYRIADVYLIDDQICLDNSKLGPYVFENCIQKFLKGKCVILVTNEIKYLQLVDQTVTIENGRIKEIGKFDRSLFEKSSNVSRDAIKYYPIESELTQEVPQNRPGSLSVLKYYFRNKIVLGLIIVTQVLMSGIDIFVPEWAKLQANTTERFEFKTETDSEDDSLKIKPFVYMYTILMVTLGYVIFQRSLTMFGMSLEISKTMHNKLFRAILNAILPFFKSYSTPEEVKRCFSHDMKNIDLILPMNLLDCLTFLAEALVIIMFVVAANPLLIIPTLAVILIFCGIWSVFLKATRRKADIETIHLNAFTSQLNSSIKGGSIIRAYQAKPQFIDEFNKNQDHRILAIAFAGIELSLLTYIMDVVCCLYFSMVCISHLFITQTDISGSSIGLAITQTIMLTGLLQRGMQNMVEMEMHLSSVTNISKYFDCECEPNALTQDILPTNYKWPKHGQIVFKNVNFKSLENVFGTLNFEIKSKEKIAILGGAEKSIIIDTLFRFYEPTSGTIKIDGFDIKKINLKNVRRNLSIISQHPIIFTGTVRYNLDPLNERSDTQIMQLLSQIEPDSDLDYVISNLHSNAEPLSNRVKQLICLARALLRHNRIIIIDESNVEIDNNIGQLIYRTIEKLCTDCTVIIVTNRIRDGMNCDRIMLLGDEGRLIEYVHHGI